MAVSIVVVVVEADRVVPRGGETEIIIQITIIMMMNICYFFIFVYFAHINKIKTKIHNRLLDINFILFRTKFLLLREMSNEEFVYSYAA